MRRQAERNSDSGGFLESVKDVASQGADFVTKTALPALAGQESGSSKDPARDIKKVAPYTPPGIIKSAIERRDPIEAAQAITPGGAAAVQARQVTSAAQEEIKKGGNPSIDAWNNTFGKAVNPALRVGFTAMQAPQEAVAARVRGVAKEISDEGVQLNPFGGQTEAAKQDEPITVTGKTELSPTQEQITAFQAGARVAKGEEMGLGQGLLPNPDAPAGKAQAEAARKYSPYLIGGHAWTPGRATLNIVSEPDTAVFDNLSGLIDATYTVGTDPTLYAGNALAAQRRAAREVAVTERGAEIEKALTATRKGRKLFDNLSKASTPDEVKAAAPGAYMTDDLAHSIANASSREQKMALLKGDRPFVDSPLTTGEGGELRLGAQHTGSTAGERVSLIEAAGGQNGHRKMFVPQERGAERIMASEQFGKLRDKLIATEGNRADIRQLLGRDFAKTEADTFFNEMSDAVTKVRDGADPHTIDDVLYPRLGVTESKIPKVGAGYQFRRVSRALGIGDPVDWRWTGMTPSDSLRWSDVPDTIENLDRVMLNAKSPWSERRVVLDNYMQNVHSGAHREAAVTASMDIAERQMVRNGMSREAAQEFTKWSREGQERAREYWVSQVADDTTNTAPGLVDKDGVPINWAKNPHSENELLNSNVQLPDYREIRRQTSALKPLFANKLVKAGTAMGDYYMNVWKLGKLFRPALAVRVVFDEQLRMAAHGGLDSLVRHPLSAIAWASGTPNSKIAHWIDKLSGKAGDVADSEGIGSMPGTRGAADNLATEGAEAAKGGGRNRAATFFEEQHQARAKGINDVTGAPFERQPLSGDEDTYFMRSHNQRLSTLYGDQKHKVYQKQFDRVHRDDFERSSRGLVEDMARISDPLHRRAAQATPSAELKEAFWSGDLRPMRERMARDELFSQMATDREWSDAYVDSVFQRVHDVTGGDQRLRDAIATRQIGGEPLQQGYMKNPKAVAKAEEVLREGAGPEWVKVQRQVTLPFSQQHKNLQVAKDAVDTAFSYMMPKESDWLSRSPTFRQSYWNEAERISPYLKESDRGKLLESARRANLGEDRIKRIEARKSVVGEGDERALDIHQLDLAAKSHGLDETKALLYDLSERGQALDIMRLVFPFGEAWKEVLGRWAKLTYNDPTIMRKGQLAVEGARDAGFFSKDANGQEVFNIPGAEFLTGGAGPFPGVVGESVGFSAPVSGLNMITQTVGPGVGPIAQLPLAELMRNNPDLEWARQFVFPYGEPPDEGDPYLNALQHFDPRPTPLKKFSAALGDPTQVRMLGSATSAWMRYNMSTGKYDTNTHDGMRKLVDDSTDMARKTLITGAFIQAFAPSPPHADYKVRDKGGKLIPQAKLADEWRKLVDNSKLDYDEAYRRFVKKHGESNMLIAQSMTEPVRGFRPLTAEGGAWARENEDLARDYPNTYGLMAPGDGEFSIDEYQRQLDEGERETIDPDEQLRRANARTASVMYRTQRDKLGSRANKEVGRRYLRDYKDWLAENYPGYQPDMFTNDNPDQIRELKELASDPRSKKASPAIAKAINEYMGQRDRAIEASEGGSLAGEDDKKYRQYLRDYGSYLSKRVKGFSRVWSYVLEGELSG